MIRKATVADANIVASLALKLWPDHEMDELAAEFRTLLASEENAVFLWDAAAFAQCGLRHDYVEGTENSPVGYLEGIYVDEPLRHQGVARQLLSACESWAKEKGCTEFASDCELDNTDSLAFHLSCGFEEANRIICFTKALR